MKGIDKVLAELDGFLDMPTEEYPQLKALAMLRDRMYEFYVPTKHIGKIMLDIDSSFFEDEEKANKAIMKLALVLMRVHNVIVAEYGDDAENIFGDLMRSMGISCRRENEQSI
jgi:hypothetical protein